MTNYPSRRGQNVGETIMGAIKSNPEGLLLLAAGCALLMRSGSSRSRPYAGYAPYDAGEYSSSASAGQYSSSASSGRGALRGVADSVSDRADQARRYMADVGNTVTETAKEYASAIGDYADDARRSVVDNSGRLMEHARGTMEGTFNRVLQDQPLAVVLLGFAAGAGLAAVLPATRVEKDTLGAVGEKLSEAASNVRENFGEAASQAGEKLTQMAKERGLDADGLKEAAGEVAGAFGSAFRGEEKGRQTPGESQGRSSQVGSSSPNTSSMPGQRAGGQSTAGSSGSSGIRSGDQFSGGSGSSAGSRPKSST